MSVWHKTVYFLPLKTAMVGQGNGGSVTSDRLQDDEGRKVALIAQVLELQNTLDGSFLLHLKE